MTEEEISNLLYHVPANADYAVDSTELDPEDIDIDRVEKLKAMISIDIDHPNADYNHYMAARLLCNWGNKCGFDMLSQYIFREDLMESRCYEYHRLHSYNDTYRHACMAMTSYYGQRYDQGYEKEARAAIKENIIKLIEYSNIMKFHISNCFLLVEDLKHFEYKPYFEQHLISIIDDIGMHGWKVLDAMEFVNKFNPELVKELLKGRGKTIKKFKKLYFN